MEEIDMKALISFDESINQMLNDLLIMSMDIYLMKNWFC